MIKETNKVYDSKFLNMFEREYEIDGETHKWNMVSRRREPLNLADKNHRDGIDAVTIVGIMEDLEVERMVCIDEYRPAIGGWTLGLPAGLVDVDRDWETASMPSL